jgi:hypothetical protein
MEKVLMRPAGAQKEKGGGFWDRRISTKVGDPGAFLVDEIFFRKISNFFSRENFLNLRLSSQRKNYCLRFFHQKIPAMQIIIAPKPAMSKTNLENGLIHQPHPEYWLIVFFLSVILLSESFANNPAVLADVRAFS